MNPESKQQLREWLLDYFANGTPSYATANDVVKSEARRKTDEIMQAFESFHTGEVERAKTKAVIEELHRAERGFRAGLEGADELTKHIMQPIVDVMKNRADKLEQQSIGSNKPLLHAEEYCHRCGGANISWSAPSPLWNEVMRGGDINGEWQFDEIICPTCFAVLSEAQGIASDFRLDAQVVNRELKLVTPSGRVWDSENWLWVEPGQSIESDKS